MNFKWVFSFALHVLINKYIRNGCSCTSISMCIQLMEVEKGVTKLHCISYYIESEMIHILKVLFNFLNVFEETAI